VGNIKAGCHFRQKVDIAENNPRYPERPGHKGGKNEIGIVFVGSADLHKSLKYPKQNLCLGKVWDISGDTARPIRVVLLYPPEPVCVEEADVKSVKKRRKRKNRCALHRVDLDTLKC
jgi:hypothetical protein